MRVWIASVLAALFLWGCNAETEPEQTENSASRPSQRVPLLTLTALEKLAIDQFDELGRKEQEAKIMQGAAEKAMANYLLDPDSAKYSSLRLGRAGAVCGKVNAKNRFGAYVGFKDFVLSKDRVTLYVSDSNDGLGSQLSGSFAEAYANACGSESERKLVHSLIEDASASREDDLRMDTNMTMDPVYEAEDPFADE